MNTLAKQLLNLCYGGRNSRNSTRKLLFLTRATSTLTVTTVMIPTTTRAAAHATTTSCNNNSKRRFIGYTNSGGLPCRQSHGVCSSSSIIVHDDNNCNNNDNQHHCCYHHQRQHLDDNNPNGGASPSNKSVCYSGNGRKQSLLLPYRKHSHSYYYMRQESPLSCGLNIGKHPSLPLGYLQHRLPWASAVSFSSGGKYGTQLLSCLVHTTSFSNQPSKSTGDGSSENNNLDGNSAANDLASNPSSADTGDDKESKSRWSNWTGKNSWKGGLLFLGTIFASTSGYLIYTSGAPERDEDGEIIKDVYSDKSAPMAYCLRTWRAVNEYFQWVKDPTSEKLLPDPLVHPYIQPPYTLVLELSGLLLKPEWDMKMGWRFKKRPGLDYLLQTCAQSGYEVVIFTLESASVGYPLTVSMDPQNVIWYRLFKEDTRYTSGVHIKDLNCLNRDLAKVILVDVNKSPYQLHPRNGVAVKAWDGTDTDRELYDLATFLQTVAAQKVEDVRTVLQHYNQFDDPMAKFRENQAAVLKAHEEMMKLQAEEKQSRVRGPIIPSELKRR